MKFATVESWVEPATSAMQNTNQQHRRLRKRRNHDFAAGADAAKTGADVHPGERKKKACTSEQRDDGNQIRRPVEEEAGGEGWHQGGGNPDRGKGHIGRHAEQPRGVVRQHHFLAEQSQEIPIRLKDRRSLATHQAGLHLAHKAG